jgi:diguanylate cyclase (GGDEF)-like protein
MAFVKSKAGTQFDPEIVALLEKHYLQLEALVRKQTDEIEPLKTDLKIDRGAAPGAGFEQVDPETESTPLKSIGALPQSECLSRIAEAGQESKAILELSSALGNSLNFRTTCYTLSERLQSLIPFGAFAVYLKEGESLRIHYIDGALAGSFSHSTIGDGEGLSGWVLKNRRAIVNGNPTVEPNHRVESSPLDSSSSALSIPLFDGDSAYAVLTLYSRRNAAFSREHLRILQSIEPKFSLAIRNALNFDSAETKSNVDPVTNLPNLRSFLRRIEEEMQAADKNHTGFTIALCDLNSFKAVNDLYGHLAGNEFLACLGTAFQNSCEPGEIVARMGGDEFLFFLKDRNCRRLDKHVNSVQRNIETTCHKLSVAVSVSASLGIAMYPADGTTAEALLGIADRRMYFEKRSYYSAIGEPEAKACA